MVQLKMSLLKMGFRYMGDVDSPKILWESYWPIY
jgi:hypothetical protein